MPRKIEELSELYLKRKKLQRSLRENLAPDGSLEFLRLTKALYALDRRIVVLRRQVIFEEARVESSESLIFKILKKWRK